MNPSYCTSCGTWCQEGSYCGACGEPRRSSVQQQTTTTFPQQAPLAPPVRQQTIVVTPEQQEENAKKRALWTGSTAAPAVRDPKMWEFDQTREKYTFTEAFTPSNTFAMCLGIIAWAAAICIGFVAFAPTPNYAGQAPEWWAQYLGLGAGFVLGGLCFLAFCSGFLFHWKLGHRPSAERAANVAAAGLTIGALAYQRHRRDEKVSP